MRRSDPLLMLADIAQIISERPEIDEALVRGIYQYLVMSEGRRPSIEHAREYIDHLTTHLDEDTIRLTVGLPPRRKRRARSPGTRSRGRPMGTGRLTVAGVREAYRALRSEGPHRAVTQEALAERLEVTRRGLQGFLKDHELTWPLHD